MPRWKIDVKTEGRRWRHYDWDDDDKSIAERDFFGCRHRTGDLASGLGTAKELARRHAERKTGERVEEVWVYDPSGNLHHKERR